MARGSTLACLRAGRAIAPVVVVIPQSAKSVEAFIGTLPGYWSALFERGKGWSASLCLIGRSGLTLLPYTRSCQPSAPRVEFAHQYFAIVAHRSASAEHGMDAATGACVLPDFRRALLGCKGMDRHGFRKANSAWVPAFVAAILVLFVAVGATREFSPLVGLGLTLLLPAVCRAANDKRFTVPVFAVLIGNAFYAVCVIYNPLLSAVSRILARVPMIGRWWRSLAICTMVSALAGLIYNLLYERPAMRAVRNWSRSNSRVPVAPA